MITQSRPIEAQQRPQPVFDKQDQFNRIVANLLQGEFVLAVYDCIGAGTGFVGITNRRVIVQDNSFVGKKADLHPVLQGQRGLVCVGQIDVGLRINLFDQHSAPEAGSTWSTSVASRRRGTSTMWSCGT